jgi:hypothetical protein
VCAAGTVTAAAGAATSLSNQPNFKYWVDELLWSQGRVATVQIEEVLEALGGQRTGGPHKLLLQHAAKQPSPPVSPAVLQPPAGALQHPAAAAAAAGVAPAGVSDSAGPSSTSAADGSTSLMSKLGLQPASRNSSSSQLTSASSSSSSLEQLTAAAALEQQPPASAAAGSIPASPKQQQQQQQQQQDAGSSDPNSSSGLAGPSRRPDDHLLGYHHVRQWDLLWTKSVYAIKAARHLQPGQVVSAIAGLNCLTMKKRMVQTLRMVSNA